MATKRKSTPKSNLELNSVDNDSSDVAEHKIELISSSDPEITSSSNNLLSEIELFESELNESIIKDKRDLILPEGLNQIENDNNLESGEETPFQFEPEGTVHINPEQSDQAELEEPVNIEQEQLEDPKKSKAKKSKKIKTKTDKKDLADAKVPNDQNKKESKKSKSVKTSKNIGNESKFAKEPEVLKIKEPEKSKPKVAEIEIKEPVKTIVKEDLLDIELITKAIVDPKIQASVLVLFNENAELKANLEKSKKILRVLKKRLDLVEEKEEQWRLCATNLGDIFAEKSHMPLEDVLRRFEAPLDDIEA